MATPTLGTVGDEKQVGSMVRARLEGKRTHTPSIVFVVALLCMLLLALLILGVLLFTVLIDSFPLLTDSSRLDSFFREGLQSSPDRAGIWQGLRGTFWIGVSVVLVAFPIGIAAAIYLEEYAPDNRLTRLITVNIRNLAGVPSVVYGILGFTVFVKALDGFFPDSYARHLGSTTLAGGITLALLALPIVIITSAEAIRSVPKDIREGAYALGATRWEVTRSHVLPYAAPGILTGTLLSLSRALGEAAPLILVGAVQGRLGFQSGLFGLEQLGERFTALPIVITSYAQRPGDDWIPVTAAATLVLLVVVLLANTTAILLRNRFEAAREGR